MRMLWRMLELQIFLKYRPSISTCPKPTRLRTTRPANPTWLWATYTFRLISISIVPEPKSPKFKFFLYLSALTTVGQSEISHLAPLESRLHSKYLCMTRRKFLRGLMPNGSVWVACGSIWFQFHPHPETTLFFGRCTHMWSSGIVSAYTGNTSGTL